ncbi:MAG: sigma-70 family RNA polymerase sigma factor [Firmicutes bacterium]|nr:sigma-70 family RNA polymerase sigma factor [Bacillota bacterium]
MDIEQAYDKIYRYAYFRVHNEQLAEDITQETFLRYLNRKDHMGNYEMRYLYTIARNLCIDEFRKKREEKLPDENDSLMAHDSSESMVTHYAVHEALAKMSEEDRELLMLRFVNEESVGTISKYYNCSRFAIYRSIKKATVEFRRLVGSDNL